MSKLHRPLVTTATLSLFVIIILIAPQSLTRAKEEEVSGVSFDGLTTGCFGPPACTSTSLLGLSFTGSNFSGTSGAGTSKSGMKFDRGFLALDKLGSFTLSAEQHDYQGTFQLQIRFTAPNDLTGGQQKTYSGIVTGSVASDASGDVLIHFNNLHVPFTFSDGSGAFQLDVFDVELTPGDTVFLRGEITNARQMILGSSRKKH